MLRPSLKVIARRKLRFHLDDLAYIGVADPDTDSLQNYYWVCLMAEPILRDNKTILAGQVGVACGTLGINFHTQESAEEAAIEHLVNVHRAMGGDKLPKGRGRERRLRKVEEWNERRKQENSVNTV